MSTDIVPKSPPHASGAPAIQPDFAHVSVWAFDLDNTLYPARSNLFSQIDQRMAAYVSGLLGVDEDEARRVQKAFYKSHGTTLNGLMAEHSVDPHDYLAFVHDIDVSVLDPDPALNAALSALPGRKVIFTNGSTRHAANVADRLGIAQQFDAIIDIVATGFRPKPYDAAFDTLLAQVAAPARAIAFFEDLPRNLEPAHRLGMTTVLIQADHPWRRDGPADGGAREHIHHETDDLTAFLNGIVGRQ